MWKNKAIEDTIQALQEAIRDTADPGKKIELTDRLLSLLRLIPAKETLWDDQDVLNFLKIKDPNTLAQMRCSKRIPYVKQKGVIRYIPDSIISWAKNNEVKMNPVWRKRI